MRSGFAAAQASKPCCHSACVGGAAVDGLAGVGDDLVGHLEGLLGVEAEHLLGRREFFSAERRSVDLAGVLLLGRGPADDRLEDDQARLVGLGLGGFDRTVQFGHVFDVDAGLLPVDGLHVPVVGLVARRDVFREGDVGVVFDRDLVGVVDHDETAKLLVAGERGRLARDALFEVTVRRDDVGVVVERARAGRCLRVEQAALETLRVGEPDGRREALAERAGRDLDSVGVAVLRVTGGL